MREVKRILEIALPLIIICMISGVMLSFVYEVTEERIKAIQEEKINTSLSYVFAGGEFEKMDGYYVVTVGEKEAGYAFIAEGNGFSSSIRAMVGIHTNGTINRIEVLNQLETPGLGTRIAEPDFTSQFEGKRIADIQLRKDGGVIDGITGATISSHAMTDSIRERGMEVLNETGRAQEGDF